MCGLGLHEALAQKKLAGSDVPDVINKLNGVDVLKQIKNFISALLLFAPVWGLAYIPNKLLETGQGGELLTNVSIVRAPEFLALLGIPYLFCMFYGAGRLLINAVPRLDFSSEVRAWLERERVLVSCAVGLSATVIALLPFYTYHRDEPFGNLVNDGFVGRWLVETGIFIVVFVCIGPIFQRKRRNRPGNDSASVGYLSKIAYVLYTMGLYLWAERGTLNWLEAVSFIGCAIVVCLLLPSDAPVKEARKRHEFGDDFDERKPVSIEPARQWIQVALAVSIILLFGLFPKAVGASFGSLLVCIVGIGAWSVLLALAFSVVLAAKHRLTISAALIAVVVALAYYTALDGGADPVNTRKPVATGRESSPSVGPAADFAAWQTPGNDGTAIIVLAEGGGIRAAYWTAAALETLSLPYIGLINRTYAIVGVSGGALGAAAFAANYLGAHAAIMNDPKAFEAVVNPPAFAGNLTTRALSSDFIGPWLARAMSTEGLQKLSRWRFASSKGETLQDAWYDSLTCGLNRIRAFTPNTLRQTCTEVAKILDGPMDRLATGQDGVPLPRLLFVATNVESGRRMLFSSIDYGPSTFANAIDIQSTSPSTISVISAAHASARFPLVSPPGVVKSDGGDVIGRAVDGGYVDASGALTAIELVHAISAHTKDFHPIIVDLNNDPDDTSADVSSKFTEDRIGEFATIYSAIQNSNQSRRYFVKKQLLDEVCQLKGGYISLKVDKNKDGPIGLGWTLSLDAGRNLDNAMRRETESFAPLPHSGSVSVDSMALLKKVSSAGCNPGARPF
ncbi:patatin-like phospholipase family protein [Paraburkholderia caribensis]|uniref:patatin-like phospholipase family protein n=1 Tax=Paraburkholderia caribensis TaxID=75105 RepID=UPI000AC64262|nr:patatin-like phospholipase family protein [Paraburkholderia caribensis]